MIFLIISEPKSEESSRHLQTLLTLCERLKVPIAPEKVEGPTTMLTFLGIEIDTNQMILRLPHKKIDGPESPCDRVAAKALRQKVILLSKRPTITGSLSVTCLQGSAPRQNIPAKDAWITKRVQKEPTGSSLEPVFLIRFGVVAFVSGRLEWYRHAGEPSRWHTRYRDTFRCFWLIWLRGLDK